MAKQQYKDSQCQRVTKTEASVVMIMHQLNLLVANVFMSDNVDKK